jgi:enterochelin esterase family protein
MKQPTLINKSGSKITRAFAALAGILAIPASVMAQTLPVIPPTGYDTGGIYPAGAVNTITYYSSVYGANEQMMVYTPPGYTTSKKYGVIYCYQGISTGIDTIFDDWCVYANVVADNLLGQGKINPVIIVAVNDQINGDPTADTINCAIPYIDSHYSTYADANHRGLYGYSWGGGYAFNIGCSHLDTFHHLSPASAAPNKAADTTLFPNGGADAKQKLKTLLISCGTADWLGLYPASLNCHNYCDANGIPNYWFSVPNGNHDAGSVWRPAMWNFLQLADRAGISSGTGPANGTYKLVARHSGKALDAYGNGTANGTQIIQWTYGGGNNQKWTLTSLGGNLYKIIGVQSGKSIDISNWGTANGTKVQLWDYLAGTNQKLYFNASSGGYYEISPSHATGSCLDVSGVSTADGALVQLWQWLNGNNQQWIPQAP